MDDLVEFGQAGSLPHDHRSHTIAAGTPEALQQLLERLYAEQQSLDPTDAYLRSHGSRHSIANHVRTFNWYRPHIPSAGAVLDWGCNHAPDCCLLRACFGEQLSLHSCDFPESSRYRVFHEFAHANYKQLVDEVQLPFPSNFFDAVIGSGVLEHAAMDYESLKELRRVLKPGGVLAITYLPNWLSVNEWVRRVVRKNEFHRRLYGMGETRQLLKRSGFYPIAADYQTFFRARLLEAAGLRRWEGGLSKLLAALFPIHLFASTLCLVARKMNAM